MPIEVSGFHKPQEQQTVRQEHADFNSNLSWAKKWIATNSQTLPTEVKVMLTSSHLTSKEFLTFSFKPPLEWYGCGYANHITLNQPQSLLYDIVQKTNRFYNKLCGKQYYEAFINKDN